MFGSDLDEVGIVSKLQEKGITSPLRARRLIHEAIKALGLDLRDLVVLTEAATRNYVYTPVIAAMAGARMVYGLTRPSHYGTVQEVEEVTCLFAHLCGVAERVRVITEKTPDVVGQADIVTNLGFVRPIDQTMVEWMKPTAVVPLMCEAWERRPDDIALSACKAKGILVLGTNEDHPALNIFSYVGWLCQKMLFDAQIEVFKSKIVVVGSDKFGRVVARHLAQAGASVQLLPNLQEGIPGSDAIDALVVADYSRDDVIIGPGGDMSSAHLACIAPGVTVIQFAGRVDLADLAAQGLAVYPRVAIGAHRMAVTLAGLGPRPVIELHAAGLRVGQWAHEMRNANIDPGACPTIGLPSLGQLVD